MMFCKFLGQLKVWLETTEQHKTTVYYNIQLKIGRVSNKLDYYCFRHTAT